MDIINIFSWIHWDPPRFLFTLPIIDIPIAWYGLFFSLGFLVGFFILLPVLKDKLLQTTTLSARDIASWPDLIAQLKNEMNRKASPISSVISLLSQEAKETISHLKLKQEPDDPLKEEILFALNGSLKFGYFNRETIEHFFSKSIYKIHELSLFLMDRLTWFIVAGTIIGARLGHVFFYEWPRYQSNPIEIVKIWEGGLASHGGAIGVMLAIWLYQLTIRFRFPELTFLALLDCLSIPTAFTGMCIRIGNFFNQEITGPESNVPWAVVFGHPLEWNEVVPRHPTQLYEACMYCAIFAGLAILWRVRGRSLPTGTLVGLFMLSVFGSRFFIEFFKSPQSRMIDESFLYTGQYLSIPFVIFGLILLARSTPWIQTKSISTNTSGFQPEK